MNAIFDHDHLEELARQVRIDIIEMLYRAGSGHLGGSLSDGKLEDGIVTCPRHGSQFDVRTGKNVGEAKIAFIKVKPKDEVCFEVKVEGTSILIGIP